MRGLRRRGTGSLDFRQPDGRLPSNGAFATLVRERRPDGGMKATLRVTGGTKVRQRLYSLDISVVRPTPHMVREALGSILRDRLPGARCLDLFAGTGAVGIEFLSRGAGLCVFVDNSGAACRTIEKNLVKLELTGVGHVIHSDAVQAIRRLGTRDEAFDVIFADPPYRYELTPQLLRALEDASIAKPDGVVIVETSKRERLDDAYGSFELVDRRAYGQTVLHFFKPSTKRGG